MGYRATVFNHAQFILHVTDPQIETVTIAAFLDQGPDQNLLLEWRSQSLDL